MLKPPETEVAKLESATHDAQEKSKSVDKDFAKYAARTGQRDVMNSCSQQASLASTRHLRVVGK